MSRAFVRLALAAALASSGLLAGVVSAQSTAPAGDAQHGRTEFIAQGCYECHGYVGQGTGHRGAGQSPGPMLAPAPVPYAAFIKQLRTPRLMMPPYSPTILSDKDAADIYAYLESIPARPDASQIPALAQLDPAANASPTERGQILFGDNCATCHGAAGAGTQIAPSLVNEKSRKDLGATISTIEHPPTGMTALYPKMLSARDVQDIAAYVQSL